MNIELVIKIQSMYQKGLKEGLKTYEGILSSFVLYPEASENDIITCAAYFDFDLPADYVNFLKEFDGMTLYKFQDIGGFKFLGSKEIVKINAFEKESFGYDWDENVILFCEMIGDAEYIGMRLVDHSNYILVDCILNESPASWDSIPGTLENFIEELIEQSGKKFWLFEQ